MADKSNPFADIYKQDTLDPNSPFAGIYDEEESTPRWLGRQALDVAKQIPAGLVAGTESIAAFPAQALGFLGGLANKVLPSDPDAERQQAGLREQVAKAGGGSVSKYLPTPQTTAGKFARTAAEFIPTTVAGARANVFSVPRAAGVGAVAGLTSEAGGQLTEGSDLEPYARIAGGLIGGVAAARPAEHAAARQAAQRAAAQAEAAGNAAYNQFRASGFTFHPQAAPTYSQILQHELVQQGLTTNSAERTWAVLRDIERRPFTGPSQPHPRGPPGLQDRYKELGSIAASAATNPEERRAARMAQERLLVFAENPPPWVVQGGDPAAGVALLRQANADWAAMARARSVNQRIAAGELRAGANYSGLNLENELRRRVGSFGLPVEQGGMRGATAAERAAFTRFGQGGPIDNTRRYIAKYMGGGGGMGALAAGGAGAITGGQYFGLDPLTAAGATTLGALGLTKYGNSRALQRSRELELMLLGRSPSVAAAGVPGTRSGVPYSLLPTLATIGEDNPLRITVTGQE